MGVACGLPSQMLELLDALALRQGANVQLIDSAVELPHQLRCYRVVLP